jgi:O-antigen ligase
VLHDIKSESKNNKAFLFFLLLSISIPLPMVFSNICLVLFVLSVFIGFEKVNFSIDKSTILPVLLYGLMLVSIFWSIDKVATSKALSKEIFLFLIPLSFFFLPNFSKTQKLKILKYYSYSITIVVLFFLVRAAVRFFISHQTNVFFYHGENDIDSGLVPKLLNAIHVSVFVAIAFFYFLKQENKTNWHYVMQFLLFAFLILLSSKNIILVVLFLVILDFFYFSKTANKMRLRNLFVFVAIVAVILSFGKLKERFEVELNTNTGKSLSSNVLKKLPSGVHNVSIAEAWTREKFTSNDYFPGTAFRVYQARMFFEIMSENNKWLTGFGLNASQPMLAKKAVEYKVYLGDENQEGYQTKNFHNQYLQVFAELGLFGILLLLLMLGLSLKTAIKNKDFVAIAFTILMISLFLTESFLWRQRGVLFFTIFYILFNTKSYKEVY